MIKQTINYTMFYIKENNRIVAQIACPPPYHPKAILFSRYQRILSMPVAWKKIEQI